MPGHGEVSANSFLIGTWRITLAVRAERIDDRGPQ